MSELADIYPWQQQQWARIAGRRLKNQMPHALLLSGYGGLGKTHFAQVLARSLVCPQPLEHGVACGTCDACRLSAAGNHPDIQWVKPEEEGKVIKIDAIRSLGGKTVLTARGSEYRVFIIDPADALNNAAANALLKTLEEPVSKTVLILVSSHPDRLPATIRSRCQILVFNTPEPAILRQWLKGKIPADQVDSLSALAGNAPLQILQGVEDKQLERASELLKQLQSLKNRKTNPLLIASEWAKLPTVQFLDDLSRGMIDLVRLLSDSGAVRLFHLKQQQDLQTLANGINLKNLFGFIDRINQHKRQMRNNLNTQMLLEEIVIDWLQITRPGVR